MANNRMYLICNVCWPPDRKEWPSMQTPGGEAFLHFGKWYPAGGFIAGDDGAYYNVPEKEQIEQFLIDHQHKEVGSEHYTAGAGQENPVRLEYESEGLPEALSSKEGVE